MVEDGEESGCFTEISSQRPNLIDSMFKVPPRDQKSVCCDFFSQSWNGILHQLETVMLSTVGFCTCLPVLGWHKTHVVRRNNAKSVVTTQRRMGSEI